MNSLIQEPCDLWIDGIDFSDNHSTNSYYLNEITLFIEEHWNQEEMLLYEIITN